MGRFADLLDAPPQRPTKYEINEIDEKRYTASTPSKVEHNQKGDLIRVIRLFRNLESKCPDHVDIRDWQQCVEDGRRFLAQWGEQAEALGWTGKDLFGLAPIPDNPHPSYRRLSRYDQMGLAWLLQGKPVIAMTETTASIRNHTGNVTTYYRDTKVVSPCKYPDR